MCRIEREEEEEGESGMLESVNERKRVCESMWVRDHVEERMWDSITLIHSFTHTLSHSFIYNLSHSFTNTLSLSSPTYIFSESLLNSLTFSHLQPHLHPPLSHTFLHAAHTLLLTFYHSYSHSLIISHNFSLKLFGTLSHSLIFTFSNSHSFKLPHILSLTASHTLSFTFFHILSISMCMSCVTHTARVKDCE